MLTRIFYYPLATAIAVLFFASTEASAVVSREGGKVTIIDRTGERWDVTQAAALGFSPGGFQYGIGRNAIRPVDDSGMGDRPATSGTNPRVIAVEGAGGRKGARAWSVPLLSRHEIANSRIGDRQIAAAY